MATCQVSYQDIHGKTHRATVQAASLFEAAALAALEFAKGGSAPGALAVMDVQIQPPVVRHRVTMSKVYAFTERSAKSPRDMTFKNRLKDLIRAVQKVR